jgi:hypothetical protein
VDSGNALATVFSPPSVSVWWGADDFHTHSVALREFRIFPDLDLLGKPLTIGD